MVDEIGAAVTSFTKGVHCKSAELESQKLCDRNIVITTRLVDTVTRRSEPFERARGCAARPPLSNEPGSLPEAIDER